MQKIIVVGNLGRSVPILNKNAPTLGNPAASDSPHGWLSDFRALISIYEKERWQGLKNGTESRSFVPVRMRLVKHFFDLYDSARLANDEASTAIMKSRLKRMAFNHQRWGALL